MRTVKMLKIEESPFPSVMSGKFFITVQCGSIDGTFIADYNNKAECFDVTEQINKDENMFLQIPPSVVTAWAHWTPQSSKERFQSELESFDLIIDSLAASSINDETLAETVQQLNHIRAGFVEMIEWKDETIKFSTRQTKGTVGGDSISPEQLINGVIDYILF